MSCCKNCPKRTTCPRSLDFAESTVERLKENSSMDEINNRIEKLKPHMTPFQSCEVLVIRAKLAAITKILDDTKDFCEYFAEKKVVIE